MIIVSTFLMIIGLWRTYSSQKTETIEYTLEGKKLQLIVADTTAEREKGLMNVRNLDNADGMIFLFPQKDYQGFWNKNTYMDLDLYWINDDDVVGKTFLPSIEKSKEIVTVFSPQPANKVIEVPRKN